MILFEEEIFQDIPLNEMYFGKIPQLLMIEELINKFKKAYGKHNAMKDTKVYRMMIKDDILKRISKLLCDAFGYKEIAITLARDDTVNAYTVSFIAGPKGESYDADEKAHTNDDVRGSVTITNRGFSFDKKRFPLNLLICLNLGILFDSPITTEELIAILLHEIGHSYSKVIIPPKFMNGRIDEKFADQFVAMYGYAPYMVSAFAKMDSKRFGDTEEKLMKIPLINIVVATKHILGNGLNRTLAPDVHPALKARMEGQIKQLEYELKNTENISPTMKKDLQNQIDECKKLIEKAYTIDKRSTTIGERMVNAYHRDWEQNMWLEKYIEDEANKRTDPEHINPTIEEMYRKKKGKPRKIK